MSGSNAKMKRMNGVKLIVGLGNPGSEYAHTRHNIGFEVIDRLAEHYRIKLERSKFNALIGKGRIGAETVLLMKPLTYMNASGEAVGPLVHFYKLAPDDLLVIHDDIDLPVGKIRLRAKGTSGGHNGMKSVIRSLGTETFARIKIGVGRPQHTQRAVISHVLHGFSPAERELIDNAVCRAADAAVLWLAQPFSLVMNKYNTKR
jgi:PTH1 family peptidyl-tRNA hydrolase